jgi:MFS family permease
LYNFLLQTSGIGMPSLYHALVVIFLEFFAWGLLTMPVISVLNTTFPDHTFLMNGLIMGIKGLLSFLSAPLVGALSDVCGRKLFLLITVFFTCLPIPLMTINTFWFFAMISISGVFAVTFSVVFAYVADVTDQKDRSLAYGLVSATFRRQHGHLSGSGGLSDGEVSPSESCKCLLSLSDGIKVKFTNTVEQVSSFCVRVVDKFDGDGRP